ncbi:MAG: hypothetical protein M1836_000589 [Candelina mexicana]|nr:MAG: hypothetical protein M1836_000589 [Candelina mexicana]
MASNDPTSSANAFPPSPGPSPYLSPSPGPSSPLRPATPVRRLSESSGSGSEYDLSNVPEAKDLPPTHKEYVLVYASNPLDLKVFSPTLTDPSTFKDKTSKPLYFVDNSVFTRGTPDVALIDGVDKTGPIIASAKFSAFSKETAIGLGSPNKPKEVVWEELRRVSKDWSKYAWTMTIPDANHETRKTFIWTRTHNDKYLDTDTDATKLCHRHLKLVDEATDEVVALFLSNRLKSWHKMGKFQVWKSWGQEWELMMLLTGLTVIEKARRRARARRSILLTTGGAGGGGGGGGS